MGDTTTNRAYRIPASTDSAATLTDYWRNLGTDIDTDVDALIVPTSDSSPGTIASGFTLSADVALVALDGHLVDLVLRVINTSAITATTGNIGDVTCYTLDTAYFPSSSMAFAWTGDSGSSGGGVISTAGLVNLTTASDTIAASSTIEIHACYLIL